MRDTYGDKIKVHAYRTGRSRVYVDFTEYGPRAGEETLVGMSLEPAGARKLARKLRKAADKAEREH